MDCSMARQLGSSSDFAEGTNILYLISLAVIHSIMSSVAHNAPDMKIKDLLFELMRQDFDERGDYAIEMLNTAEGLLGQPKANPRQAEAAAYCIRQALVEIFRGVEIDRERLGSIAKRAINAKRIITKIKSPNTKDYQDLLNIIDEMKDLFKRSSDHEAYLKAALRQISKCEPMLDKQSNLKAYRQLICDTNKFLHDATKKKIDLAKVRCCYAQSITVLSKMLLPGIRSPDIVRLAELNHPHKEDMDSLKKIMVSAYDFDYFARKMVSAGWFALMDPQMLKTTSGDPPWPLRSLAHHLKDAHVDALIHLIRNNFKLWTAEDAGLGELGFVGFRLGERGLLLLVRVLERSKQVRQRRDKEFEVLSGTKISDPKLVKARRVNESLVSLDHYSFEAYLGAKSPTPEFVKLAEHLMDPDFELNEYYKINTVPVKLVEMMDSSTAVDVVLVLIGKIQTQLAAKERPSILRLASIADMDPDSPYGPDAVVGNLSAALRKAREFHIPTARLVETLSVLPDYIRHRLVAWLYSGADDIDRAELVDFAVNGCGSRLPTGDDDLLLGRLKQDGCMDYNVADRLNNLIGDALEPERMTGSPSDWNLGKADLWRIFWAYMLRHKIELPSEWGSCMETLRPFVDKELETVSSMSELVPDSPATPEEPGSEDPRAVAARMATRIPEARDRHEYAVVLATASEVRVAVKQNAAQWAQNPIEIIDILRHPAYVAEYFDGLARSIEKLHDYADQLISAVRFARTHWHVVDLSQLMLDYDISRVGADIAGINLIETMARKNIPLGDGALSDAWDLICEAAADRTGNSSASTTENPFDAAECKVHTRALGAMLWLIVYAADRKKDIPKKVLTVLTESVKMTGRDGEEHRAVLGADIQLLRTVLPDWFKQIEPLLLGSEVSVALGQTTLDTHLQRGRPDKTILKSYRSGVLDAVKRDVPRALVHLLCGMFWRIDGYDPKFLAKTLIVVGPDCVSKAGMHCARMLRDDTRADHTQRGIDFWGSVLDLHPEPEALIGYGWWADVLEADQGQWEDLMLRTCEIAMGEPNRGAGMLERAGRIAERINSQVVTDTGLQILVLLMRGDLQHYAYEVAEQSIEALCKSKDTLSIQNSWGLLRELLLEQGFFEAAEL